MRYWTIEEYQEMDAEMGGWCHACGAEVYNVEPDACNYRCDECGEDQVYGASETLMMGMVR